EGVQRAVRGPDAVRSEEPVLRPEGDPRGAAVGFGRCRVRGEVPGAGDAGDAEGGSSAEGHVGGAARAAAVDPAGDAAALRAGAGAGRLEAGDGGGGVTAAKRNIELKARCADLEAAAAA